MHDWKRFWHPISESPSLSDDGFLTDPEEAYGDVLNPSVVRWETIHDKPCLALVGEPGIGKSTAIRQEVAAITPATEANGDSILTFDLAEFSEESRLVSKVFGSATFSSWASGTNTLHLFLDGLDECRFQIRNVAKVIISELREHSSNINRLRLRIACRTVDWPKLLADGLHHIYGDGAPSIYALAPLRRKDVYQAAIDQGVDADKFISDVIEAGAQSLVIKPVTTNFLLGVYKSDGKLPDRQVELYEKGCDVLCAELSSSRIAADHVGLLASSERLLIAELVAAVIVFCNKNCVLAEAGNPASGDEVPIAELLGVGVGEGSGTRIVDLQGIRETLATALFTSEENGRVKFAHRTYAEFLAASFLVRQRVDLSERLKLIQHPDSFGGRVVPQLRETAAWLAGMDSKVFSAVAKGDPQVLLKSDIRTVSVEERVELVDRLIGLARGNVMASHGGEDHARYSKLKHARIAEQLKAVITNKEDSDSARAFAIDVAVAVACVEEQLDELLVDIALDDSSSYSLRCSAACAAVELADGKTLSALKPLALAPVDKKLGARLKGEALRHLWPSHVTADELFSNLQAPTRGEYGSYGYFLAHELPDGLTVEALPHALRWASEVSKQGNITYYVRELVSAITTKAWKHLDDAAVQAATIKFFLKQFAGGNDALSLDEEFPDDERKRRMLTDAIIPQIEDFEKEGYALIFSEPRLVRSSDVEWLVAKLLDADANDVAIHWAKLIERLLDYSSSGQLDCVVEACEQSTVLAEVMAPRFTPVELHSPDAARRKAEYEQYQEWSRRDHESPPLLDPPPAALIAQALEEVEQGNAAAWFHACRYLQLDLDSSHFNHDSEADITTLPGWIAADLLTRGRLIRGAAAYLNSESTDGEKWLGTNSTPYSALWGYKALLLLLKESRDLFAVLPVGVWEQWAASIIDFAEYSASDPNDILHNDLAVACVAKVPETVRRLLRVAITQQTESPGFFMPQFTERAWGPLIEGVFLDVLRDEFLSPSATGALLDRLLEKDSRRSLDVAVTYLKQPIASDGDERERACAAAVAILRRSVDPMWRTIWPLFQQDTAFGKAVFQKVAYADMHNPSLASRLDEEQVGQLFIWLEANYPSGNDPKHEGAHFVSEIDAVVSYRSGLLRGLQGRGTSASVEALRKIYDAAPNLTWMPPVIAEAFRLMLRKTWRPIVPRDLITATRRSGTRLVLSAAHLQDVLVESLGSLQQHLQGENPAARDIWDKIETAKYRPIDENDCSDYIKRFLQTDLRGRGIIALREVEIRRGRGGNPGERTDLYVSGMVPGATSNSLEQVRVIIEVKGSWHDEVDTAIETQLVNRYLKDNECAHGIYIVLWFRCPQWDAADNRLSRSPSETSLELQSRLEAQARDFTNETQVIRAVALNAALR